MKSRSLLLLASFACSAPAFAQDACTPVLAVLDATQNAHCVHSDDLMTRALCNQALFEATHEKFDFDPKGDAEAREASVQRWEAWWKARSQDPLLQDPQAQVRANEVGH